MKMTMTEIPDPDYESKRRWRLQNPEKTKASSRKYYQLHRSEILERNKAYNKAHRSERSQKQRGYRIANREMVSQNQREYRAANSEKTKEWRRARYILNREAEAEKQKHYVVKLRKQVYDRIAHVQGFSGPQCMMSITPFLPTAHEPCSGPLQIDHIAPKGNRTVGPRNSSLLRMIRDGKVDISAFRLLCKHHNCWHYRIDLIFESLKSAAHNDEEDE